jgi:hypothetical protein
MKERKCVLKKLDPAAKKEKTAAKKAAKRVRSAAFGKGERIGWLCSGGVRRPPDVRVGAVDLARLIVRRGYGRRRPVGAMRRLRRSAVPSMQLSCAAPHRRLVKLVSRVAQRRPVHSNVPLRSLRTTLPAAA